MSKILINTTAAIVMITDTGVPVPALGSYTIPPTDYQLWSASNDIIVKIGNGTLIVNDGSFDLSISDGTDLIKGLYSKTTTLQSGNTPIGAIGDRLKVDAQVSFTAPGFPQEIDITKLLPIGYGASLTVPLFPTIKPLGHYKVPTGKKFRLIGVMFKTAGSSSFLHVYTRTMLWKFNATTLATTPTPTLTARTISGSGLATVSTYRYKIVGNNSIGNASPSVEVSITLTGTSNAVSLTWANLTGAFDYNIYRTFANGATNTQKLVGSTDQLTFVDILTDAELDTEVVPAGTATSGNLDVSAYAINYGTTQVVIDTMSPITSVTPLDIIYKNIYGEKTYISATPGAVAGAQVTLQIKGVSNPLDNKRIKIGVSGKNKKRIFDVGINDIVSVGNTPATGEFVIYGHNHFYHMASQQPNKWDTQLFPNTFLFPSDEEIIFGISGNASSTVITRHDVILLGLLE